MVGEGLRSGAVGADDDVLGLARTVGSIVARQVGDPQQQLSELHRGFLGVGGERPLVVAQRLRLGLQRFGLVASSFAEQ